MFGFIWRSCVDDAAKRNAAYAAWKNGRCPECDRQTVIANVKIDPGPDGRTMLKECVCAGLDCEWRWP